MNRDHLKILGFYVLAALLIARVIIMPLKHSLSEKKNLLKEYEDTYNMRMLSFERYKASRQENKKTPTVEEKFKKSLYTEDIPYSTIQSDIIGKISVLAEKRRLILLGYEFSDPVPLKAVTETPVVIRLSGEQKGIIALLGDLETDSMKLVVRRFEDAKNGPYTAQCSMTISAFRLEK